MSSRDAPVRIEVDARQTFQTMRGWEVNARAWHADLQNQYDDRWEALADTLFDRLVEEVGINRVRLEVKSGAENPVDYWTQFRERRIDLRQFKEHYYAKINDNADPRNADPKGFQFSLLDYEVEKVVQPLRRRLAARGERLYVNLNYVDFRGASSNRSTMSHAREPAEYAELIRAAFDHLKTKYDLVPDALELILEPELTDHWRGREIGQALVEVAARLAEGGYRPEFIGPSTTKARAAPQYLDDMLRVPGTAKLLSAISFHRYDMGSIDDTLRDLRDRARRLGIRTEMLEHLKGDAAELHADLTLGNVAAWQQFGIANDRNFAPRDENGNYLIVDYDAQAAGRVRMAVRTPALAMYFRNIRAGAVRIAASSDRSSHAPVAFRHADGTFAVVVQAAEPSRGVMVRGLPAGKYAVSGLATGGRLIDLGTRSVAPDGLLEIAPTEAGIYAMRQLPPA